MAKKPTARVEYAYFDVTYEDGSLRSNRKVPADAANDPYDKDKAIRDAIEEQDRTIAERSGVPPMAIKAIKPSK